MGSPELPLAIVVATRSQGKLAELLPLIEAAGFGAADLEAVGCAEEAAAESRLEVHETFELNALAKARWFAQKLPGRAILAEDSGLEVRALDGAPGVRSKRWTDSRAVGAELDAANNAALVAALAGKEDRAARYVCAAVCVWGARTWSARGETTGRIVDVPRGSGGFGYDPHFVSDDLGKTFAEATREEKAKVSHRGRAIVSLLVSMRTGM